MFSGIDFFGGASKAGQESGACKNDRKDKVAELVGIAEELSSLCLKLESTSCTVMEVRCLEKGCPPLETCFAVLDKGIDCKWKVQKPLMEVMRDDVVDSLQAWLRGDAPPCACDIAFEQGANDRGSSIMEQTRAGTQDEGPTMEEIDAMMDAISRGTL